MIQLDQVGVRLGDRAVLSDISLTLTESRVGLIGANGSGKSTLTKLLNGLVTATTGRVAVAGLDPATQGPAVRRQVGYLFTDPDAQIVMPTPAEDVAFSLRRLGLTKATQRERALAALAQFGLAAHADTAAHVLSGGEKQLLALAAILVTEPTILVADEPTTLLDLRNSRQVARIVNALPQQVILATHDLTLVEDWPRVIALDEGLVVDDGPGAVVVAAYRERMSR